MGELRWIIGLRETNTNRIKNTWVPNSSLKCVINIELDVFEHVFKVLGRNAIPLASAYCEAFEVVLTHRLLESFFKKDGHEEVDVALKEMTRPFLGVVLVGKRHYAGK